VGNVTNHTISGLAPGKYYVTVTAYDISYDPADDDPNTIVNENQTNGSESWYAEEKALSLTSSCSTWAGVISQYNVYVSGTASWSDVINCYNQYVSNNRMN